MAKPMDPPTLQVDQSFWHNKVEELLQFRLDNRLASDWKKKYQDLKLEMELDEVRCELEETTEEVTIHSRRKADPEVKLNSSDSNR